MLSGSAGYYGEFKEQVHRLLLEWGCSMAKPQNHFFCFATTSTCKTFLQLILWALKRSVSFSSNVIFTHLVFFFFNSSNKVFFLFYNLPVNTDLSLLNFLMHQGWFMSYCHSRCPPPPPPPHPPSPSQPHTSHQENNNNNSGKLRL